MTNEQSREYFQIAYNQVQEQARVQELSNRQQLDAICLDELGYTQDDLRDEYGNDFMYSYQCRDLYQAIVEIENRYPELPRYVMINNSWYEVADSVLCYRDSNINFNSVEEVINFVEYDILPSSEVIEVVAVEEITTLSVSDHSDIEVNHDSIDTVNQGNNTMNFTTSTQAQARFDELTLEIADAMELSASIVDYHEYREFEDTFVQPLVDERRELIEIISQLDRQEVLNQFNSDIQDAVETFVNAPIENSIEVEVTEVEVVCLPQSEEIVTDIWSEVTEVIVDTNTEENFFQSFTTQLLLPQGIETVNTNIEVVPATCETSVTNHDGVIFLTIFALVYLIVVCTINPITFILTAIAWLLGVNYVDTITSHLSISKGFN